MFNVGLLLGTGAILTRCPSYGWQWELIPATLTTDHSCCLSKLQRVWYFQVWKPNIWSSVESRQRC